MCADLVKNVCRNNLKISARGGLVSGGVMKDNNGNLSGGNGNGVKEGSHSVGVVTRSRALQQQQQLAQQQTIQRQ